jgi:integrase/recombinase XerD
MRRARRKDRRLFGGDPHSLRGCADDYLGQMLVTNRSERTVAFRGEVLGYLIGWCEARGVRQACEVTKPLLERYQRHLYHQKKKDGAPLSFRTQYARLVPVRGLFKWLCKTNRILFDPASGIELPKWDRRLPKHVLTPAEADAVLDRADVSTPLGVRDRAILETLYSTGMRRMELAGLKLYDIDADRGTVMVRQGKGKKDRMIPVGDRALAWIDKYLIEVRPTLAREPDGGRLWLNAIGEPILPAGVGDIVRAYVDAANIGKRGSCHLFRHTMATAMLEGGADIRFIQAMLGHAKLDTTEIYTQVSIRKLKEVHSLTHPARLERAPKPAPHP